MSATPPPTQLPSRAGRHGRAAVGRAVSFNFARNVAIPSAVNARRPGTRRKYFLPDRMVRPARRRTGSCQPDPVHNRAGKAQVQNFLFRVRTRDFSVSSVLPIHQSRPSFVWITHPRRPVGLAPPLSRAVRAHVAPKRLRCIHTAWRLCALRLSLPLAYRFSTGRAGDAFRSVLVPARWPATSPTQHGPSCWPSVDPFAVSASGNPSTRDCWGVLHDHPPLLAREQLPAK